MMKADLHIHSTISDGSCSVKEIIEMARSKGLDAISITDHDTVSQIRQISDYAGIKIIPGIEISSFDYNTNIRAHILGYNIKDIEMVENFTKPILEARHRNSLRQIEILNRHGYEIEIDKVKKADGNYIYKQHIMDYLVNSGKVIGMFGEFYYNIFKNNGICHFDIKYLDVYEAVKTIKNAGGFAVLAHSGQQQNFYLIPQLVECGLDGLELNHHSNSEEDKVKIREYANQYNLFLTGGSDFHGKYEPQRYEVGDFLAEESGVLAVCGD